MLTSIISAAIILGVLIIVHETGHFVMAKRCGVRVLRFSIGYPPKLWGIRRGETEYAISATLLGGYVRMLGDEVGDENGVGDGETLIKETGLDLVEAARANGFAIGAGDPQQDLLAIAKQVAAAPEEQVRFATAVGDPQQNLPATARGVAAAPAPDQQARAIIGRTPTPIEASLLAETARRGSVSAATTALVQSRPAALVQALQARSFPTQSVGKRILIVLAGPLANYIFAPVALAIVLMYGVPRLLPILGQVKQGLPASSAGLHPGDRIVAIDGHAVATWDDLSGTVKHSDGRALKIEFERQEKGRSLRQVAVMVPSRESGQAGDGWVIGVLPRGDTMMQQYGPISAAGRAVFETGKMTVMLVGGIMEIVKGTTPLRQALGGPIMIAQLAGEQAHLGFANVAIFTVMLSIELAIINLIPVPLLDGGHLLFFLVEGVRGKPVAVRHREMAQRVGLVVLVALMAFVIFNDISRIVQG
jgi:regulator of sigma E protease